MMERIPFLKFRSELARRTNVSKQELAILAPIIYEFEDKYFDACCQYLLCGSETEIIFGEYSTKLLTKTMDCSYIEALVILHNMEKMPRYACYIYAPKVIE